MRYLLSAYSINPYKGSEDGVGWNWLLQYYKKSKKDDEIYVITKKYNEEDTKKGMKERGIYNVNLIVVDVPKCLNWFREKNSIFHHMYYILWQYYAYRWVKKSKIQFDIVHHVTMGDFRILGFMYKIKDAYTIFGPVGGAQITPKSLKKYERKKISSKLREFVNNITVISPFYRKKINDFSLVIASNQETYKKLKKIKKNNIIQMPEIACKCKKNIMGKKRDNEIVKILFCGRLIEKKGIEFLLEIINEMPKDLKYEFDIYGDGKYRKKIEQFAEKNNQIKYYGEVKHYEIEQAYNEADIFVMTSLRETGGTVLVEAMEAALPIVAFDMSFCSEIKKYNTGLFVNVNQNNDNVKKEYIEDLCKLIKKKNLREELGTNGWNFVNKVLTWDNKYDAILNFTKERGLKK